MVGNCFITARELIGVTHMKIDVLKILERDDKWYLEGGTGPMGSSISVVSR